MRVVNDVTIAGPTFATPLLRSPPRKALAG